MLSFLLIKYFTLYTCELFARVLLGPPNVRYDTYFTCYMLTILFSLKFMVELCYLNILHHVIEAKIILNKTTVKEASTR
jgi:hypothetical protein